MSTKENVISGNGWNIDLELNDPSSPFILTLHNPEFEYESACKSNASSVISIKIPDEVLLEILDKENKIEQIINRDYRKIEIVEI